MSFPVSPTNGQITTVNGIRYSYNLVQNAWIRISSGKFTAAATGPSNPATGDHWYNTGEDTLYEYVSDGVSSYWIDIQTGFVGGSSTGLLSNTTIAGTLTMTGNIVPSANITYSLGTSTQRFKDLFLSGNTIDLGGATIKTDAASGAIALIPQPTVANPNPTGIVVSPSGTVSTVSTTGGTLTTNAISNSSNTAVTTNTTTFGNVTANGNVITANVYADRFFYSNGTAFSSSNFGNTQVAAYLSSSNAVVGTGAITVPSGTTAQRPGSPVVGMVRFNYTLGRYEAYLPLGGWQNLLSDQYTVDYLIVAGGGAGAGGASGEGSGGGGGAGGLLQSNVSVIPQTSYTITVGGGGTGVANDAGSAGTDSSAFGVTSAGGGRGSQGNAAGGQNAGNGGSGGGSGFAGTASGTGISGQGNNGGNSGGATASSGGGGAGAAGSGGGGAAGAGGVGVAWLNGTYYAGGGGGGRHQASASGGAGGNGGGGAGGLNTSGNGTNGDPNSGGGGGGGGENPIGSSIGGNGGGGVVIVRYLGTQRGTGGTYSFTGGYSYHTFTGTSSFTA